MRICLAKCPAPFLINENVFPPLGLLQVGSALKKAGHNVTIFDEEFDSIPLDFEYYGFGPTIAEYSYALKARDRIRQHNPTAKIIVGGPYATLNPYKCKQDFDCVVVGDGEKAVEFAFAFDNSILFGAEGDLNSYPKPDRSLLDLKKYEYYLEGKQATTMMTSQGCPFKCAFCCKNYQIVRFKSLERVVEEIDDIVDLGYKAIAFPEDLFILNKERVIPIINYLGDRNITWRCLVRGDIVVKHGLAFANFMQENGCVDVGIGVESGSDTILKTVNKGEKSATILKAIEMLDSTGIRVKGFFILGLPGETLETMAETRAFIEKAPLHDLDIKIYQPYVGSPIVANKEQYDIQWDDNIDFDKLFYKGKFGEYYGNVRTSSLTTEQIYKEWVDMESTYKKLWA